MFPDTGKIKALRLPSERPRESLIEAKVVRLAKSRGYYCRKYVTPNHRSSPDRILISPTGDVFFLELKRPGGKPTPNQMREHARIRAFRRPVYVVDSFEQALVILDLHP